MILKKTDPAVSEWAEKLLSGYRCDFRKMFGCPAYFVNGNMFAGAFGDALFLRLSEADRAAILKRSEEVVPFEPLPGRIMKEYVSIPEGVFAGDAEVGPWVEKSYGYAVKLKPKEKAKKSSKPKRGS